MGFFDKIKTQATNITSAVTDKVGEIGGDTLTASKENAKLLAIKAEITSIEGNLEIAYKEIGKKYVDHIAKTGEYLDIGVADTLKQIEPLLEKKQELENELIEIEKRLKDQLIMKEKEIFQREFEEEKAKLEKAYKMDVLSKEEYEARLAKAKAKLDNFEEIRKIKKQYEMGIISEEEMNKRLKALGC